ncbi:DUF2975 domain-containing protein [Streptomyces sp. NPDC059863]|uniref:DUF2975 domain-containing protein n=1 Tax=unclassified Streptomyces TaxID=2593676 RepID=UPI0036570023
MNTRLTRTLASVTFVLAVLCGLAFVGKGVVRMADDGAVCVQTDFWRNASLADGLPVATGVDASSSAATLCQDSPSAAQRAADLGGELPWLLFGSLALLLFSRLLKAVLLRGRSPTRCRNGSPFSAGSSPWVRRWPVSSSAGRIPGSSRAWRRS